MSPLLQWWQQKVRDEKPFPSIQKLLSEFFSQMQYTQHSTAIYGECQGLGSTLYLANGEILRKILLTEAIAIGLTCLCL